MLIQATETTTSTTTDGESRLRFMADRLDYFTEDDFILLTAAAPATVQSWRKRGIGPDYILIGNRYFYPRDSLARYMDANRRQQAQGAKAAL